MSYILPYPLYFLIVPIGLRLTCYYFHGWYEEKIFRRIFPIFLNFQIKFFNIDIFHRIFLLLSLPLIIIHILISIYHTIIPMENWVELNSLNNLYLAIISIFLPNEKTINFTLINFTEWIDSILLACYVLSCHVIRYFFGSCAKCFVKASFTKVKLLECHSKFNNYHGTFFWLSVISLLIHSIVVYYVGI